jgi:hypothetical protein
VLPPVPDGPLRLAAIRHARFGRNPACPALAPEAAVWAERLPGYGIAADPARPLRGNRNSYAAMAAALLAGLYPADGPPRPAPELVILAHALPDCVLSDSASGFLAEALGGRPLIFAVSDQGRATPYAALALAQAHDPGGRAHAAVLIVDQGTLFYDDPALAALDTGADHGVGLALAPGGPVGLRPVRQLADVPPGQVAGLVAAAARELGPATLVAGAALPALPGGWPGPVRRAPASQLCTSVWSTLAAELARPGPAGRAVLAAEYDPDLRYLSLAVFDVPAGHAC